MILQHVFDAGMVVGPVIGYVYQYQLIYRRQSVGTFSIDICGILLFANITRLNFYLFEQYAIALFLQSCLMILVQLMLLRICKSLPQNKEKQETALDTIEQEIQNTTKWSFIKSFWRWPSFVNYLVFILCFSVSLFLFSLFMRTIDTTGIYGSTIGLVALTSQSILILPQIITNCQQSRVKGVSHLLLSLNLIGDILKLIYFIMNQQPFQFWICGITQVILDSFVIMQIFYYRKNRIQTFQQQQEMKRKSFESVSEKSSNKATTANGEMLEEINQ